MISIARSGHPESRTACEELAAGLPGAEMDLLLFFCSSRYDLDALSSALARNFPGVQAIGCTSRW